MKGYLKLIIAGLFSIILIIAVIFAYSYYAINQPIRADLDNLSDTQIEEATAIALNSSSFPQAPNETTYKVDCVEKLTDHYKGIPILEAYGKEYPIVRVVWFNKNGSYFGSAKISVDLEQKKVVKVGKTF